MSAVRKSKASIDGEVNRIYSQLNDLLGISGRDHTQHKNQAVSDRLSLNVETLERIAQLAADFTAARKTSRGTFPALTDSLDREGVELWNSASSSKESLDKAQYAMLRLAGFRLIEASMEGVLVAEALQSILRLATRAASALSESDRTSLASEVLASAAQYEEDLRNVPSEDDDAQSQTQSDAIFVYYLERMETAWREGNESVAFYMLQQATTEQNLQQVTVPEHQDILRRILQLAKSCFNTTSNPDPISRTDGTSAALTAVRWLQYGLKLLEKLEGRTQRDSLHMDTESQTDSHESLPLDDGTLKRAILSNLASAYITSAASEPDNLSRAEATISEILTSTEERVSTNIHLHRADTTEDSAIVKKEMQRLRWMRVAILKRRKAVGQDYVPAFEDIIRHFDWSEESMDGLLHEVMNLTDSYRLQVGQILHFLLRTSLSSETDPAQELTHRVFFTIVFHFKSDPITDRALTEIEKACDLVASQVGFELDKTSTAACQSVLWALAEKLYRAKKYGLAAKWFILAAHPAFKPLAATSNPKCLRKAALSYIEKGEYAQASAIMRRVESKDEAANFYVEFLAAVHQGLDDEATGAIRSMLKAPDFDRKMLLVALELAHERNMKSLLLTVLEALLKTLRSEAGLPQEVEGLILTRTMIRLSLDLLDEPTANIDSLVSVLLRDLRASRDIIAKSVRKKEAALIAKDISWLWRTCFNTAVDKCLIWDGSLVAELFDLAVEFMGYHQQAAIEDMDSQMDIYRLLAGFCSIHARVLPVLESNDSSGEAHHARRELIASTKLLRAFIADHKDNLREQQERIFAIVRSLFVYEAKLVCQMKEWVEIPKLLQDVETAQCSLIDTYESFADILWIEDSCPINVLCTALEAILRISLNRDALAVEKFSRWLRAICDILLARNTRQDRLKALGYVVQAADVIKDTWDPSLGSEAEGEFYPSDEIEWLLVKSYNQGIECWRISQLEEANRWLETALVLTKFVPNPTLVQRVMDSHRTLLSRYNP